MVDVLLDYESLLFDFSRTVEAPRTRLRHQGLDLRQARGDIDPVSSVGIFPRLHNPHVLWYLVPPLNILDDLVLIKILKGIVLAGRVVPTATFEVLVIIRLIIIIIPAIFAALDPWGLLAGQRATLVLLFPDRLKFFVPLLKGFLPQGFTLLRHLSYFSKILGESAEFSPRSITSFDQEGQRQHVERVLAELAVKLPHVDKHALLVRKLLVLLHLVIYPEPGAVRGDGSRYGNASVRVLG